MAVKKSSGETKIQDTAASKKAAGKKSAAKKETAPQKSTLSAAKPAAPKKAAAKKAAAPVKLSVTQTDMLKKIGGTGEPGYKSEKKGEQRTIEALQERKLIKRGTKDKASGTYHYSLSNAGKKHLDSSQAGGANTPPPGATA